MKQPDDIQAAQKRFAELVKAFDPKKIAKEHPLEPFKNDIHILREQGAPYKVVATMLTEVGVKVCVTTVARFCKARKLGASKRKASPKRRERTSERTPKNTGEVTPKSAEEGTPKKTMKQRRGPRIADPGSI